MQILMFRRKNTREEREVLLWTSGGGSVLLLLAGYVPLTAISLLSNVQSELVTVAITSVQVRIN